MKQSKLIGRYALFFVVIQIITLSCLHLFKNQEFNSFISERQTEINGQYILLSRFYLQRITMIYERNIATPEVLTLMEKASTADEEERTRLRRELYGTLLPLYQYLQKNGFRQVHFHFADNTSFLRMHLPDKFGDQLAAIRPSVVLVNTTKNPVFGYEMGRHWQAYRFIFPLATAANHHIGSVEIDIPFSTLLNDLMTGFPAEYRFIVRKQMAAKHLDKADLQNHFTASPFSPEFLSEKADQEAIELHTHPNVRGHVPQEQIEMINQALARRLAELLPALQPISLPLFLADKAFLVHLLPIRDISAEKAGYLINYEQSHHLIAMQSRYTMGYILVTVFSLLLIFLHSWYTVKLFKRILVQRKLQQELNDSHSELDQIFNTAADGMWLVDLNGKIKRANNTLAHLLRLPLEQIIGKKCSEVFPGSSCHTTICPQCLIKNGAGHVENDMVKTRPDGTMITCMVTATPYYNGSGELVGMIEDFRDISERKQMEQQLQTLSTTDELTGLCNRRGFMNLAQRQLDYVKRAGGRIFLLFADLDNMKWINDTLGHEAGDKALVTTAGLLRTTVRDADIVGRMGGDEFAVLLTAADDDSETAILNRLERNLAEINRGLPAEQQIAISFGIVQDQSGSSLEALICHADAKMYAVKKRRKAMASQHCPV